MKRKQVVLLGILLLAAALTAVLLVRNPEAPLLPPDADHAEFRGADGCVVCHDRDGPLPRSPNHPIGRECLHCHGRSR